MPRKTLEQLLITLDVAVEAFALCEVKKGYRLVIRPANAIEVHYVLAGTLHLTIAGQPPVVCPRGSIVVIPPKVGHSLASEGGPATDLASREHCSTTSGSFLLFDAAEGGAGDVRIACGLITRDASGSYGMLDELTGVLVEDLNEVEVVRHGFHVMLAEFSRPEVGTRAMVGSLMKAFLILVLRRLFASSATAPFSLGRARDPRLTHAVMAVLDKPSAPHTVASLSVVAGMGRSTFTHRFAEAFAMGPMEFVAKTRMHHAAEMLRSTMMSVKVIAASVGFSSRSHFSRAFREIYGKDPSSFRSSSSGSISNAGETQALPVHVRRGEKDRSDGALGLGVGVSKNDVRRSPPPGSSFTPAHAEPQ